MSRRRTAGRAGNLSRVVATLTVGLGMVLPGSVAGQDVDQPPDDRATGEGSMGRIVAVLIDGSTGAPITEALVTIEALSRRTLSDSTGAAVFLDVPPGSFTLTIRHIAYGEQSATVDVQGMTSAIVAIRLDPRAVAVAPLEVLIEQRPRYLERQGFYDRRVAGLGSFFDPMFVDRWGVGGFTTADRFIRLLIDMSPQMGSMTRTTASNGNAGIASIGDGFRGQCPPVYIDGQRVFNDPGLSGRASLELEMLSTYSIGAVEVYPSSHGVPDFAFEPDVGCGSIVIWTNRWRGRTRELGGADVRLCEPQDMRLSQVEGVITDEYTGVLLPGARVIATSYPAGHPNDAREEEIIADRLGRYRVCDVPPDHTLTLQVDAAGRTGPELQVPIRGRIVEYDLSLRVAGPGRLVGRVLDRATGRPVAAATIGLVGMTRRTQTDSQGYFSMADISPGDQVVEITHLGFEPIAEIVSVVADRTVDLDVQLSADPIALEPLVVTALRDRRLEIRGFYDRRIWAGRTGLGQFLGREELERRGAASVTDLLRAMPGIEIRCTGRDCEIRSSRTGGCTEINVYINGTLTLGESRPQAGQRGSAISIDQLVRPSEIAALEVYGGAASVPAEFSGLSGRCGAVAIWTK